MQYTPELLMNQRTIDESLANDLQLALGFMVLSNDAPNRATARKFYEKARVAHDAVDQLLRRRLPTSPSTRAELGAAIAKLRSRLAAYESAHF